MEPLIAAHYIFLIRAPVSHFIALSGPPGIPEKLARRPRGHLLPLTEPYASELLANAPERRSHFNSSC